DADVLLKLLKEFDASGRDEQLELRVALFNLRERRKRGVKKLLAKKGKNKPSPARTISLNESFSQRDAIRNILAVRYAETLTLSPKIDSDDDAGLHAFRLACKRLH